MNKELIKSKQKQAAELLNEFDIDMWITFVRETGNIKDPMLEMIAGTGATWHSAFIIAKDGSNIAIIGNLEKGNLHQVGTFDEVIAYDHYVKDDLLKVLDRFNPQKIAINYSRNSTLADGLTHGVYLELMDILKGTPYIDRLVSSEDIVAALRGRKSQTETDLIRDAIKETLIIFDEVTGCMKPGMTEKQIAQFVINKVEERGFDFAWDVEHCPAVYTGPDSAGAHAAATDRVIEKGHVVNMDFGVKKNGYCADLQRTWYILKDGETDAPEPVKKGLQVIYDAITKSAEAMKPGKIAWEVDDVARSYITAHGYPEYQHGLGHQLGRVAHDGGALLGPRWERYKGLVYMPLEEGQVFTIEPRLPIEGMGIATIEEEVVIHSDGVEFMSDRQREVYLIK